MTFPELPLEGIAVAEAIAKATVVLAAATLVSFTLRRSSAALRHLVWTLALCSAIALPVLSLALPKWQLPILRIDTAQPVLATPAASPSADEAASARMAPSRARAADENVAVAPNVSTAPVGSPSWTRTITWPQAIIGLWLIGAGLVFARVLVGLVAVQWLSRRTEEVGDAPWLPMAREMAFRLGITPRMRFLRSGRASMPVATGIFRPAVIMPADADTWSESRLRIVLLHELAHVKRRDCLTHILAQTACALHWFNPLAWIAARRARTERERACDDLVLAAGTRGAEYADQLLEIARAMRGDRFPGLIAGASLAMAHRSQLEGRLIAILDPKVPRLTRVRARLATIVCFCAVAPLGALQPWGVTPAAEIAPMAPAADIELTAPAPATPQPPPVAGIEAPATPVPVPAVASPPATPSAPQLQAVVTPLVALAAETALGSFAGHDIAEAVGGAVAGAFQKPGTKPDADPKPNPDPKPSPGAGGKQPDPRMVAALTAALKDTDKEVRETAMHALVQMRHPSIYEPLVQSLKDASPEVREQAAFGLGQLRDRRAVQPLIGSLKDENAEVREQAAFALGQLRDASAVEALGTILRDVSADVREQVVFALGQIRDRRAVEPLISALKDEKPDVREQAAFALGQIRDRGAVEALVIAIKDANADVREQVAFALGQLRDERAIEALTIALKDQSADVRQQAAFALGQLAR